MAKKTLWITAAAFLAAVLAGSWLIISYRRAPATTGETTEPTAVEQAGEVVLTYATHWQEKYQIDGIYDEAGNLKSKGLRQYLDEYSALHPNVRFEIKQIVYPEYAGTLQLLHDTDAAADIYQIYSSWGVEFENRGVLDNPPEDVKQAVRTNYVSTAGVTIGGDIWGIPTEINDYALIYNKDLLKEAGIVDASGEARPPRTFAELLDAAVKTAKKDARGNLTQYGFAFTTGDYGFVGGPVLSLLFSNEGGYLADDLTKCRLSEPAGVEAVMAVQQLFKRGATDVNGNVWDFGKGKVAMIMAAPWVEGTLRASFGDKFDETVGTAPVPYLKKPASLQYSWFMGVMNKSRHKQEAWDFLRWFALETRPETGTTRYGDLLAETIGAVPSRQSDLAGHAALLSTPFKKAFVEELSRSVPEPNVLEGAAIGDIVMRQVQSTWSGQATPEEAMTEACAQINGILERHYRTN